MSPSIIFIVLALLIGACESPKSLREDNVMPDFFTDDEIKGLDEILAFFEGSICENSSHIGKEKCFKNVLAQYNKTAQETGNLEIGIKYSDQLSFYDKIDSNLSKEIWRCVVDHNRIDSIQGISLKLDSKYVVFIKTLGERNYIISKYYSRMQKTHFVSASSVADVLVNHEKFDVSDVKIRLFLAIHYLGINDSQNHLVEL